MYHLICTSYTETEQGLVLRNNWIETIFNYKDMYTFINRYELLDNFEYPDLHSISKILIGKLPNIDNTVLHVRIIRVS